MSGSIGEVGAAFVLDDRASAALARIGEAFEKVQGAVNEATAGAAKFAEVRFGNMTRSLNTLGEKLDQVSAAATRLSELRFGNTTRSVRGLADAMATLGGATEALPATFESAMNKVVGEVDRAVTSVRTLRNEMLEMDAVGRGSGGGRFLPPPSGGGGGEGRGRRGGGHGWLGVGERGIHVRTGIMFSPAAIGGGLLIERMLSQGGKTSLSITNALIGAGEDPTTPQGLEDRKIVEDMIAKATPGTRYSREQAAAAAAPFFNVASPGLVGQDGKQMSPHERVQSLAGIYRPALLFAEEQQQAGYGSIGENMLAAVRYAHLMREYDPEKLNTMLNELGAMSRGDAVPARVLEGIEKYSVTTGGLMGSNLHDIALGTGFLVSSGVTGSTAGTGMSRIMFELLGADPSTASAPKGSRVHSQRQAFERALRLQGEPTEAEHHSDRKARETAQARHLREETQMGLIGPGGKRLFLDDQGGVDVMKAIELISKWSEGMAKAGKQLESARIIEDLFKDRGARALEPFLGEKGREQFLNYKTYVENQAKTLGSSRIQEIQSQEPIQQFQQSWASFNDALIAVSKGPLHDLGEAAVSAAGMLQGLATWFDKNQASAHAVGDALIGGMLGAAGGAMIGGPLSAVVGGALGAGAGGLYGHGLPKGGGGMPDVGQFDVPGNSSLGGPGHLPFSLPSGPYRPPAGMVPYDPHGAQPGIQRESFEGSPAVNIQNINFGPGTPREHAEQFADELSRLLSRRQLNDLGSGWGHQQSGYSLGRTLSV